MFQVIFLFYDLILIKQIIVSSTLFFSWLKTGGDKKRIASKSKKRIASKSFFYPFVIEFFGFASLWLSIQEKIHTKTVVDMPRGGDSFENCFTWEETSDLPGSLREGEVCLGDRVVVETTQITHKMNFIQDSFQDCQIFPAL